MLKFPTLFVLFLNHILFQSEYETNYEDLFLEFPATKFKKTIFDHMKDF